MVCKSILQTNGNVGETSSGYLKQFDNQAERWKLHLLSGRHFSNKEPSSSIKSIQVHWPAAKLSYVYKYWNDQETNINNVTASEYQMDNDSQSSTLIENNKISQTNETDRQLLHANRPNVRRKLLFGITRNIDAPSSDIVFTDANKAYKKHISSDDISHGDSYSADGQNSDNLSGNHNIVQLLNNKCKNCKSKFRDRLKVKHTAVPIRQPVIKTERNIFSGKHSFKATVTEKIHTNINRDVIEQRDIGFVRDKRDSDWNNQSAQTIVKSHPPTGTEIYQKLFESIESYLNMSDSLDDSNFTYSIPPLIEAICPVVIEELYGNIGNAGKCLLYITMHNSFTCLGDDNRLLQTA